MLIFYHFTETTVLLKSLSYLPAKVWIQTFQTLEKKISDKSLKKLECNGFKHSNFIYVHVLGTWSQTLGDGFDGCGTVGRWQPLQEIS